MSVPPLYTGYASPVEAQGAMANDRLKGANGQTKDTPDVKQGVITDRKTQEDIAASYEGYRMSHGDVSVDQFSQYEAGQTGLSEQSIADVVKAFRSAELRGGSIAQGDLDTKKGNDPNLVLDLHLAEQSWLMTHPGTTDTTPFVQLEAKDTGLSEDKIQQALFTTQST